MELTSCHTYSKHYSSIQWTKNGDHPQDGVEGEGKVVRYFRHPNIPDGTICPKCHHRAHDHGHIELGPLDLTVCPGDWIIQDPHNLAIVAVLSDDSYRHLIRIRRDPSVWANLTDQT